MLLSEGSTCATPKSVAAQTAFPWPASSFTWLNGVPVAEVPGKDRKRPRSVETKVIDGVIRVELPRAHEFVPRMIESLPAGTVRSISVGQPTLEDVFVRLTGHRFRDQTDA